MREGWTGVLLAAGDGRRMGPLGERLAKACMPVANRPLVHHQLDLFRAMGLRDVVVVVGFRGDEVRSCVERHAGAGLDVSFVEQPARRGIADALRRAERAVAERTVVLLADTYFMAGDLHAAARAVEAGEHDAVLSIRREPDPERIRRECSVRYDERGRLLEIREKPASPFNDLKPCGIYFFRSAAIFEAILRTPPSALRGEVELTDAIQTLVTTGHAVGRAETVRWDVNINFPADLLLANLAELRRLGQPSLVAGAAAVHPGARLEDAVVGRARIEDGVILRRALVLDDAVVAGPSEHEGAILGEGFALEGCLPADEPLGPG